MSSDEMMNLPNIQSKDDRNRGRKRANNEDFVASYQPADPKEFAGSGCLYIVADGVGSTTSGERASEFAAQKVLYEYYQDPELEPSERLRQVITRVNAELYAHAESKGIRMATTLTAAIIHGDQLIVANVGDSRAYLIRNGQAKQLTRDHSIAGEMLRNGEITEREAQVSRVKNKLTRSIGGEAKVIVDVVPPIPLQPGDKVLLCTDGLTRYALPEDIVRLTTEGMPDQIVPRLIDFANQRGGADNIAVSMIAFEPQPVMDRDSTLDTLTEAAPPSPPRARKPEIIRSPFMWAAIAAMAIILLVIGYALRDLVVFPASEGNVPPLPVMSPSPTPTSTVITPTLTPVPVITDTPIPQVTPTEEPYFDPNAPTPILSTEPLIACEYTFKKDDTLIAVASKLGSPNYQNAFCSPRKENLSCQTIDHNMMMSGYILIFPNSQSKACKNNSGKVLVESKVVCDKPETCQVDLHEYPSISSPLLAYLKYDAKLMLEYVCLVDAPGDGGRWFMIYPYYPESTISKPMWIRERYVRDGTYLAEYANYYCPPSPTPAPTFTLTPSSTP